MLPRLLDVSNVDMRLAGNMREYTRVALASATGAASGTPLPRRPSCPDAGPQGGGAAARMSADPAPGARAPSLSIRRNSFAPGSPQYRPSMWRVIA